MSVVKLKNKIIYRRAALFIIQKNARMLIARNKYRPRCVSVGKLLSRVVTP